MTVTETQPSRITRPDLSFAYLMTAIAIGCIVVSGVLGSIFTPGPGQHVWRSRWLRPPERPAGGLHGLGL